MNITVNNNIRYYRFDDYIFKYIKEFIFPIFKVCITNIDFYQFKKNRLVELSTKISNYERQTLQEIKYFKQNYIHLKQFSIKHIFKNNSLYIPFIINNIDIIKDEYPKIIRTNNYYIYLSSLLKYCKIIFYYKDDIIKCDLYINKNHKTEIKFSFENILFGRYFV